MWACDSYVPTGYYHSSGWVDVLIWWKIRILWHLKLRDCQIGGLTTLRPNVSSPCSAARLSWQTVPYLSESPWVFLQNQHDWNNTSFQYAVTFSLSTHSNSINLQQIHPWRRYSLWQVADDEKGEQIGDKCHCCSAQLVCSVYALRR